jgi:hypothetical protein
MKKDWFTVQEISGGTPYEPEVDTVCLSKGGEFPCSCLFAPSLLHLGTSDHIWIHLTNSHHPCRTVQSAPLGP